jgi:FkbM family methyltransferase
MSIVRLVRSAFRHWPFMRGRGWILRLARRLLGPGPVRFDLGGGVLIDGTLDDWMILWPFMGLHERDAPFQHSLDLVRCGDVVFDVGAHLGIWSLLAARRGARVHAFEPVPAMVERLRAHAGLNGLELVANTCAIGAEAGASPFFAVRERNSGASGFAPPAEPSEEIRVPVETLDAYVARSGIARVDVIKLDVEGAELLAFQGARRLLSAPRAPVLFFELDPRLCARLGVTPRQVKQLLVDYGYHIYRWREAQLMPVRLDEPHAAEDLFALKS